MQSSDTTSKLLRLGVIALGEALVFLAIKAGLALVSINPLSAAATAGVVALTFAVEDLWSASKGEPSFLKGLRDWGKSFDAYLIEKMTEFGQFLINVVPNQIKTAIGFSKVIAAPMLIMQADHIVSNQTLSKSAKFAITAEQIL